MNTRFGIAALLIAVVSMPMFAQEDTLTCERVCNFEILVPPVLQCSDCILQSDGDGFQSAVINVSTNACVSVSISSTPFQRQERDCDGNLLQTVDVLDDISFSTSFTEIIACQDGGSPMQVRDLGNNQWKIAPHRGGFQIAISAVTSAGADICDDAGCYSATVRVLITAEPVECPDAVATVPIPDPGHD